MASRVEFNEADETKERLWILEQKLDQSMDEKARRLRNMYREKVKPFLLFFMYTNYISIYTLMKYY